jgi:pyruvate formate lyase activating enzyme
LFDAFEQSLELLLSHSITFEVRTTIHSDLISKEDLTAMVHYLEQKAIKANTIFSILQMKPHSLKNWAIPTAN